LGNSEIAQVIRLVTQLDDAGLKSLHSQLDETEAKGSKVGSAFGAIGKGLAIVGGVGVAGAIAGLGESIHKAADFEQSLNNVAAATNATSDELQQLRASALQTGKDTALSASDAVEAYGELAKAGLSVKDIVGGAGRATVDLAVSQNASVQDMATLMSASLNTFGLGADKASEVANILGRAAGASAIDVGDLSQAIQNGGSVAVTAGLSIQDFTTAVGLLGQHGIKGAEAGTELKTMFLALEAPSSKAAGALQDIGVSMFDAEGKTRKVADVFKDLQGAFAKMTDEERARASKDIFGSYGITAANILLLQEGKDGWDKFTEATAHLPTVAEQSATRMKGLNGQIEQLKGSAETLAIGIGTMLLPGLTKLAGGATDVLNKLIDGDWKGAGQVILSGLGDALGQAGKLITGQDWGNIALSVGNGLLAGLRASRDIAAKFGGWLGDQLGAGFLWLKTRDWGQTATVIGDGILAVLHGARNLVSKIGDWLGDQIGAAFAYLSGIDWGKTAQTIGGALLSAFQAAASYVSEHWQEILVYLFTGVPGLIVYEIGDAIGWDKVGQAIVDGFKSSVNLAEKLGAWIGDEWAKIDWKEIGKKATGLVDGIGDTIDAGKQTIGGKISDWFKGLDAGPAKELIGDLGKSWGGFLDNLKPSQAVLDGIGQALGNVLKAATPLGDSVSNLVSSFGLFLVNLKPVAEILGGALLLAADGLAKALDFLGINGNTVGKVFELILSPIATVLHVLGDLLNFVADIFAGRWSKAWDDVQQIFIDVWHGIEGFAGTALDLVGGIFGHMLDTLKQPFVDALTALGNGELGLLGSIKGAITGAFQGTMDWFAGAWSDVSTVVTAPIRLVFDLLGGKDNGLLGDIWHQITGVFQDIWQWFKDSWSDISNVVMAPFDWLNEHSGGAVAGIGKLLFAPFHAFWDGIAVFVNGIHDAVNWVTSHIGLGDILGKPDPLPVLPGGLARGTTNWRGGMAWLGEQGPELGVLPAGAAVLPHEQSMALVRQGVVAPPEGWSVTDASGGRRRVVGEPKPGVDIPGFLFGLDPGAVLDTLKAGWSKIADFAKEWLAKGAEALASHALDLFNVINPAGSLGSPFGDIGTKLLGKVKDGVVNEVKELLGLAAKAQPVAVGIGGGPVASDIITWANAHAAALGIDARQLATLLVAISDYENGLSTFGDGPFQLSGDTKASAIAAGFNPQSASSSLDFLASIGRVAEAVRVYLGGGGGAEAGHAAYLAQERPNADVDAARVGRGDWDAAWALAQAIVAGPNIRPGEEGQWVRPLAGGYTITQGFGPADPSVVGLEPGGFHYGVDLASFRGDSVLAVRTGVVHAAGMGAKSPGLGIAVVLDHANGLASIVGHLLDVTVGPGQVVQAGDLVGHEDSTGLSTGDHVHLQIEINGTPVDPRQFVALAGGGIINEEIVGIGRQTSTQYRLGEAGPEAVLPLSGPGSELGSVSAARGAVGGPAGVLGDVQSRILDTVTLIAGRVADILTALQAGGAQASAHGERTATATESTAASTQAIAADTQSSAQTSAAGLTELQGLNTKTAGVGSNTAQVAELTGKHLAEATATHAVATQELAATLSVGHGQLAVSQDLLDNLISLSDTSQEGVSVAAQIAAVSREGLGVATVTAGAATEGVSLSQQGLAVSAVVAANTAAIAQGTADNHGELVKLTSQTGDLVKSASTTAKSVSSVAESTGGGGGAGSYVGGGGGAGGVPAGGPNYILGITTNGQLVPLYTPSGAPGMGGSYNPYWAWIGAAHFADGGLLTEPVAGMGLRTGQRYLMGEAGPEYVTPADRVGSATVEHHYHLEPGAVVIPASDIEQMQKAGDFFARLGQEVRSRA
jgi:TP901 family phage tail tape measure protein